jgi:hypothetical protein
MQQQQFYALKSEGGAETVEVRKRATWNCLFEDSSVIFSTDAVFLDCDGIRPFLALGPLSAMHVDFRRVEALVTNDLADMSDVWLIATAFSNLKFITIYPFGDGGFSLEPFRMLSKLEHLEVCMEDFASLEVLRDVPTIRELRIIGDPTGIEHTRWPLRLLECIRWSSVEFVSTFSDTLRVLRLINCDIPDFRILPFIASPGSWKLEVLCFEDEDGPAVVDRIFDEVKGIETLRKLSLVGYLDAKRGINGWVVA